MPEQPQNKTDALSEKFQSLTADNRASLEALRPSFSAVSALIGELQEIGFDRIGVELASHEKMKALRLAVKGKISAVAYMVLSIHETRYLLRVKPDNIIDLHLENLNKYQVMARDISSDDFWYRGKDDEKEARFCQYDLSLTEGRDNFSRAILQTAAICATEEELKEFDRPAEDKAKLIKKPRGGLK
jgi:hypothetical protein